MPDINLAVPIQNWIVGAGAVALTEVFISAMLIVFTLALLLKLLNRLHAFTQYAPTMLTSLGILGTFFGIVAGLLEFNVNNIDGSIEHLLSGMKTAFTTSLVGMALSIVFKLLVSMGVLSFWRSKEEDDEQIGIVELYTVMRQQRDAIVDLHSAVGGDNESSLSGQLKLLRSDTNDNHKQLIRELEERQQDFERFQSELWRQLQDFSEMMSKSATEQVINALKEVIRDFNNNLIEQFGDNFKQLNAAVVKLVEWQENYKQQLGEMQAQYAHGVTAITQTEASVASIDRHAGQIPASMEQLQQVLEVNQHQVQELGRHLDAFKDIRDRAVEAVPEIREQIDATVSGVREAAERLVEGVNEGGERMHGAMIKGAQEFVDGSQQVNASLQDTSNVMQKNSEETRQYWEDFSTDLNASLRTLAQDMATQAQGVVDQTLSELTTGISGSSDKLQAAMAEGAREFIEHTQRVGGELQQTSSTLASNNAQMAEHWGTVREQIAASMQQLTAQVSQEAQHLTSELQRSGEAMLSETARNREAFTSGLEDMRRNLDAQVRSLAQKQVEDTQAVMSGLRKEIEGTLGDTGEAVRKQVTMIEQTMNREIEQVMSEMGRALASIAGQFTDDYRKLVNAMRTIVKAA